jgi:uncharacterized protein YgiM (DUF1202 family)
MSRFSIIVICSLLIVSAAGCYIRPRNLPVAPMPLTTLTPGLVTITPPWIITATQAPTTAGDPGAATPNAPAGAATNTPASSTGPTLAPTALPSEVKSVLVKDDVRLRRGPGAGYDILGLVHAGMTLIVTGKSSDGSWWQVFCDQGPNNICWVSADPELTEAQP